MNNIIEYFLLRKWIYITAIIMMLIYHLICFFSRIPFSIIFYATELCFVFLVLFFCFDYYHHRKRIKILTYLYHQDQIHLSDLPLSQNIIEDLYQNILVKIETVNHHLETTNDQNYQDMKDYFTLWVHQIKIPLSALRLMIQSGHIDTQELLIQTLKIEQYVDMVLHYIKVNHMSSDLSLQYASLEKIIHDVIQKQATFFIHKKIKLVLDSIDLQILTDEKWISFVLEQILSNALKYTKEGFIHIYVKDETLYIQDSGIGIQAEDLPRVTEKGYTGYNGRLDKKASGIGLYLCQKIIDHLGYTMHIDSTVKVGTCVSINFHVDELEVE